MTTIREIKRLARPLISSHSDLKLIGHSIFIMPARHFFRRIVIDRTWTAERFRLFSSNVELYAKQDVFFLGRGRSHHIEPKGWLWTDPNLESRFLSRVEEEILPELRSTETFEDFVRLAIPADETQRRDIAAGVALHFIALGQLDDACTYLAMPRGWRFWQPHLERLGLDRRLMEQGSALGMDDRATLAGLLHEWEAYTVGKLKLESIWEKTPFPLEELPAG